MSNYQFSLTLPLSITNTMSGIVIPVSAIFVAKTIFLKPFGGFLNISSWLSFDSVECNGKTLCLLLNMFD